MRQAFWVSTTSGYRSSKVTRRPVRSTTASASKPSPATTTASECDLLQVVEDDELGACLLYGRPQGCEVGPRDARLVERFVEVVPVGCDHGADRLDRPQQAVGGAR